jgi:lysozyme family protein
MKHNWQKAFEQMLASEGGFSDDERDRGNQLPDGRKGSTMLGVTQYNWERTLVTKSRTIKCVS